MKRAIEFVVRHPWGVLLVTAVVTAVFGVQMLQVRMVIDPKTILPQRHPFYVAKEAATLDVLSLGRVVLGVGFGWLEEEFKAVGVPFESRAERTEESIAAIRELWGKGASEHHGRHYDWPSVESNPKPVQARIPIVIGGHTKSAARRAARVGDGFFPARPDTLAECIVELEAECARVGRKPSEIEITTGLLTRLDCKDKLALAKALLTKWEAALREHALGWLPPSAPFGLLLTYLDAITVADCFRRVVESSLGEGHSLFEIVEREGLESTAHDLYDRAEHLCQLRSRDIEQYNVNPCSVTIVRFPPPVGPRDAVLRERLAAAFLKLGHCSLVEGSAAERNAITVIRTTVGWPIGIEGGNSGLLQEYAKAGDAGHLPHLIGIVTGTEYGEPIPSYVQLARELQSVP